MELVKKGTSQISTSSEYLTIYAPKALARYYGEIRTVAQALAAPSHSVGRLKNVLGTEKVEALIKLQLVYLNEMLNLKRPLGELQIDEIAAEVVAIHHNLTMADVHVIMRRARSGHYGEFYESLTMPKVLSWFGDYFEERCDVAAQRSMDHHAQVKEWNDTSRKSNEEKEREAFAMAHTHHLMEKARRGNSQHGDDHKNKTKQKTTDEGKQD